MSDFPNKASVLFVCLGNICRSPAAEGVMLQLIEDAGLSVQVEVDSAGTAGYHIGKTADARMIAAAKNRNLDLQSRSRKISVGDLEQFELIIAMDRENLSDINRLSDEPRATIKLLSDYLDEQWPTDVPDPYYGGDEGFETVLDMLEAACPNILDSIHSG